MEMGKEERNECNEDAVDVERVNEIIVVKRRRWDEGEGRSKRCWLSVRLMLMTSRWLLAGVSLAFSRMSRL